MRLTNGDILRLSSFQIDALVLAAFGALAIIFTYPVAFSANTIPGDGIDGYFFMWNLWALKNALLTHTNPLFSSYLFYPIGVSLVFSTTSFFNAALSIPLQLIWDLPHAYTFVWLLSFPLSGFGTFLLMRYLGVSTKVAFICGLIFMFSPYRFAHGLGHLNLMATEWIPFYALFFLKTLREEKRLNPVLAGLFLSLTAFSDFHYVVYLLTFSLLAVAYDSWIERRDASLAGIAKRTSLTLVVFGALASPLLIPMLQELLHGNTYASSIHELIHFSASPAALFLPSPLHPLIGSAVAPLYLSVENIVFAGYVGLALSTLVIFKQQTREVRFWAIALAVFLVLSFGPVLKLNGIVRVPSTIPLIGDAWIPLPYRLLMYLPGFSIARVPSRWDIMVMLCIAVLSGFALEYLISRVSERYTVTDSPGQRLLKKENALCFLCAGLILFEFLSVPYPTSSTLVPSFYQTIASDPEQYAVFEVGSRSYVFNLTAMYYQTTHHKPLVNGYVSRMPPEAEQFILTEPVVHLLYNIEEVNDSTSVNTASLDPSILADYHIRYVIVHREKLTLPQVHLIDELFKNASQGAPVVYDDGSMVVYRTQP